MSYHKLRLVHIPIQLDKVFKEEEKGGEERPFSNKGT